MKKRILLTGATGVVGSAILSKLVELKNNIEVYCLIRAKDNQQLKQKFQQLVSFCIKNNCNANEGLVLRNIIPVKGDITQKNLGLCEDDYQKILRKCTCIIHCAGTVRLNHSIAQARNFILEPTKNILDLAKIMFESYNLRKIEYVSTIGVAGKLVGRIQEDWLFEVKSFHNTYEKVKAEAELLIFEMIQSHNLPITVHRPSMVVGDSVTGKIIRFQVFYYLCEFLSGMKTRGFVPKLNDYKLDIVPVDFVAKAIIFSSNCPELRGRILHLCSGEQSVPLPFLIREVRKAFSPIYDLPVLKPVPLKLFVLIVKILKVLSSPEIRRALNTLPYFLDYLSEMQLFENQQTIKILKKAGIYLPEAKEFIPKVLNYYIIKKGAIC